MTVAGLRFCPWEPKSAGQGRLGVCEDKAILSPSLLPLATSHLLVELEFRPLLRHLRVKSRKQRQLKGAWFDAGEWLSLTPPSAPGDQRPEDMGLVCIYPCVCFYVELVA